MTTLSVIDTQRILLLRLIPKVYERTNHPVGHRPPYTLKYVEAMLRNLKGYSVKCIDQQITTFCIKDIEEKIRQWQPQTIVFEVTTLNMEASRCLCEKLPSIIDRKGILRIGIGQEVSADVIKFREQNSQFDICLAGEAEQEIVSIAEKFVRGDSITSIRKHYSENGLANKLWTVKDIDRLPFLHYDDETLRAYNFVYPLRIPKLLVWGHMITSRGCPHPCIFCSQLMRESYSTNMRYRSAMLVVDEMEHLLRSGTNIIAFDDEDFTVSERHVRAVCEEILLRKLKVHWIIHGRVDELNEALLKLLGQSGCILIRMGIESGNRRILSLLAKTNRKDTWFDRSREIVKIAQSNGISVACLFMVGSPTETKRDVQESIEFAKKLNPEIIQVAYFTPFPGTKAYALYKDKIPDLKVEDLYHYNFPKFNLSNMSDQDLKDAQGLFYRKFLLRPSFIVKHFLGNFLFYMANYKIFLRLLQSVKKF